MKTLKATLWAAVCAAALVVGTSKVQAQRGNFDPAQMRQDRLEQYRTDMDVKDDAEWKLIEAAINKVMDAERDVAADRMRGMFRRRNRGNGDTSNTSDSNGGNNRRNRGGGFFGQPSQESEDLQKAVDSKAPTDEVKAKLAKFREAAAARELKLTQAQDELKAMLTSRQEAVAVLGGLLK